MVLVRLGPSTATTRMASTRLGIATTRSMMRITTTSTMPRMKALARPSTMPMTTDTSITDRPMPSEMRAP